MTTALDIQYALMAGASYISTRFEINKFPVPDGWIEKVAKRESDPDTGFEATYFTKGTEVVISYAGTYPGSAGDWAANFGMATGIGSFQLQQAVDYYLQVKADNPGATNITLTGHSLGGGLAALVGVFFGVSATTFDQAPFANSAQDPSILASLNPGNVLAPNIAENLLQYLQNLTFSFDPADVAAANIAAAKTAARNAMVLQLGNFLTLRQANGGIPNSNLINTIRVDGEFTSSLPVGFYAPIGNPATVIDHGPHFSPSIDLHDQALLTTFLQSQLAVANTLYSQKTLSEVTKKLTDLLGMIFDKNLFWNDTDTDKSNFLENLVRHQAGGTSNIPTGGDAMVTRFTSDLWKLAQDSGMTIKDGPSSNDNYLSRALTAFAMQKYYEEKSTSAGYKKELFTDLSTENGSGGIRFDMANVSDKFAAALANNQKLNLTDAKGYDLYLKYFFDNNLDFNDNFTVEEDALILTLLPYMRDWYIQAGLPGMIASDANGFGNGAFMLGGTADDYLTGGTGADLLVGNRGDDVLAGGMGNDVLIGGMGLDTYRYNAGEGLDTLLDRDGNGALQIDGGAVTGGTQFGDSHVYRDTSGHLYTFVNGDKNSPGPLIVNGNYLVQDYQVNQGNGMGMSFDYAAPDNISTSHDITGDPLIHIETVANNTPIPDNWSVTNSTYQQVGNEVVIKFEYFLKDADGNPTEGGQQSFKDILNGTAANDHIKAGEDRDFAYGKGGNDFIEGGVGADVLDGGADNDYIYGDKQISIADAIAQGNIASGPGQMGDWLSGGSGDDVLIGSNTGDVLMGGGGQDLLIAGAGDDVIDGDVGWVATDLHWSVTNQGGVFVFQPAEGPSQPIDSKGDVIYAGAGNDYAWGGQGNDVIFGEDGIDHLSGNGGNDVILGGEGIDYLWGDGTDLFGYIPIDMGSDYLDGGAGDDEIHGEEGDDIILGGKGDDKLYGGAGQDTYIYNRGDGIDTIFDSTDSKKSSVNILRFGEGINSNNITLRLGSFLLDLGNGDAIHINNEAQQNADGFDRNDVFNSSSIDSFVFADGSTLSTTELMARGFDLGGTTGGCAALLGHTKLVAANDTNYINTFERKAA